MKLSALLALVVAAAASFVQAPVSAPSGATTRLPSGPIPDAEIDALLKKHGVPGVSVAVIRDFAVDWSWGYGVADVESGARVTPETMFQAASISKPVAAMVSLKAVEDRRFTLDQDVNRILTSWTLPGDGHTRVRPVTPRMLMSHTSGTGDAFGFPGYPVTAPLPALVQILDGLAPSNRRAVRLERAPMTGFEYSGGGVMIQQLALEDAVRRPFVDLAREWVLQPLGMAHSTFQQPLPPHLTARAARAHDRTGSRMADPWHVYPELAAAGLWTTAGDLARLLIDVQKTLAGESARVLSRATMLEMVSPVGVGPFAVGFQITKDGEGWYFHHSGSNWGFRANAIAHRAKGYGYVIMTNGDNGGALIEELGIRIEQAYGYDMLDKPIPRAYGPVK